MKALPKRQAFTKEFILNIKDEIFELRVDDYLVKVPENARRITVEKVETNDLISWLGGIKETTAKYIYKRGAFRSQMLTLYPNIEWEQDLIERDQNL